MDRETTNKETTEIHCSQCGENHFRRDCPEIRIEMEYKRKFLEAFQSNTIPHAREGAMKGPRMDPNFEQINKNNGNYSMCHI